MVHDGGGSTGVCGILHAVCLSVKAGGSWCEKALLDERVCERSAYWLAEGILDGLEVVSEVALPSHWCPSRDARFLFAVVWLALSSGMKGREKGKKKTPCGNTGLAGSFRISKDGSARAGRRQRDPLSYLVVAQQRRLCASPVSTGQPLVGFGAQRKRCQTLWDARNWPFLAL